MNLYLMQHGRATSKDEDPERPLTDLGREEVERVASFLAGTLGDAPLRVFHSGKLRARQTAEVLGEAFGASLEAGEDMGPTDDPEPWTTRTGSSQSPVVLVGHLPHLSRLCALLVRGSPEPPVVTFTNGAMVCLEEARAGWTVRWIVSPELIPVG